MTTALVVISVLLALGGALSLSNATLGVGVICLAVACGIWARINQAAQYRQEDLQRELRASNALAHPSATEPT